MINNQNMSNAYVIREGKFNVMFKDNDNWHIMERFGTFLETFSVYN